MNTTVIFVYKHAWRSHSSNSQTDHKRGLVFHCLETFVPEQRLSIVIVRLYQTHTIAFHTLDGNEGLKTMGNHDLHSGMACSP